MRVTVPAVLAGERIDRVVALLTGCSRAEASAVVAAGAVHIGPKVVTSRSVRVAEGDVVDVVVPEQPVPSGIVADPELAERLVVVHEDDSVVVIDKPAGLVVHPGAGNRAGTLVHGLVSRYPEMASVGASGRPGIVHRLDKDTSGLMLAARTEPARVALAAQLAERAVTRRYLSLVWGGFDARQGVIDAPIARSGRTPTRMAVSTSGRSARTHYEVLRSWDDPDVTLVECTLDTGRTHQIRVHLAAIGNPVVGDRRYGGHRQTLPVARQFLHAATLEFDHPRRAERLSFSSALPADLADVVARLD